MCYKVGTKTESCAITYSIILWGVLGVFKRGFRFLKSMLVVIFVLGSSL